MSTRSSVSTLKLDFPTEACLVDRLDILLQDEASPWGEVSTTKEWDYRAGYTDLLAHTHGGKLVAFEAKLSDWKKAFFQAYRNTSFAHEAYVIMPKRTAMVAMRQADLFESQGVGLCTVEDSKVVVLIAAREKEALAPGRRREALTFFEGMETYVDNSAQGRSQANMRRTAATV